MKFKDRAQAGISLSKALAPQAYAEQCIVLALPRGGVPVAAALCDTLHLLLDICLIRKLGVPGHEELAMGAAAFDGTLVFNEEIIQQLQIPKQHIEDVLQKETQELHRRNQLYRQNRPLPALANKSIVLIDDGLATGASMRVAIQALRHLKVANITVAVPVGPSDVCASLSHEANKVICLWQPEPFYGVGYWYEDFTQVSDQEVILLLNNHWQKSKK